MTDRLARFKTRLEHDVLSHPIIVANPYTAWFKRGTFTRAQARAFLIQFSVFSNQFLVAQLHKTLNAETVDEMHSSKEILANEIGVGFLNVGKIDDAELGSLHGSIEGGTFHFRAAHFELLVRMARQFGLSFADLGKRRFGTDTTLFFCDELIRLYGHEEYSIAAAASWAVENWAAAGFWDELVEGWDRYRSAQRLNRLDVGFFTWHARLEANHSKHTWEELSTTLAYCDLNVDEFVRHANEMLDAVAVFWRGLDAERHTLTEAEHAKAG
jgi:pyrroloquinoline quinone (PQQ) biosynthesis protein C